MCLSGRLEEIPGEEGFPANLDSSIKGVYERAGVLKTNDGSLGSLTMIGTVSPPGGNFEEPVTQSTLGTVKTFLGLSSARAYKRFYPAVDPPNPTAPLSYPPVQNWTTLAFGQNRPLGCGPEY